MRGALKTVLLFVKSTEALLCAGKALVNVAKAVLNPLTGVRLLGVHTHRPLPSPLTH